MRTRPTVMHARRPRRRRTQWRGTHVCSLLLTSSFTPGGTTTRRGGTVHSTGSAARAVPHQAAGLFTFQNQRSFLPSCFLVVSKSPETPADPFRQVPVKPRQAGRDSTSLPRPLKGPNKPVLQTPQDPKLLFEPAQSATGGPRHAAARRRVGKPKAIHQTAAGRKIRAHRRGVTRESSTGTFPASF
jgi:hypothetical protein